MSDGKAVKFNFDNDFEVRPADLEKTRAANTLAQVEDARNQAYGEGIEEGRRQALSEIESHTAKSMERVANTLETLQKDGEQLRELSEGKAAALSLLIAQKIAGQLIAERPEGIIETVILEALRAANRENILTLYVSDDLAGTISERIDALKAQSTFAGALNVVGSAGLHGVDCRVEWTDGGLEHDQSDVARQIEEIIVAFLKAKAEKATQAAIASPIEADTATQIEHSAEISPETGIGTDQV